ncbi:hypothetical protein NQ314_020941, partial [Rhamnusium bicolor]
MVTVKYILTACTILGVAYANLSAVNVLQDMYHSCLQNFSVSCVKLKALRWFSEISDNNEIKITEDLFIVKNANPTEIKVRKEDKKTFFEKFENFLQTHDMIVKAPTILSLEGPLGNLIPRSFQPEDIKIPLAVT